MFTWCRNLKPSESVSSMTFFSLREGNDGNRRWASEMIKIILELCFPQKLFRILHTFFFGGWKERELTFRVSSPRCLCKFPSSCVHTKCALHIIKWIIKSTRSEVLRCVLSIGRSVVVRQQHVLGHDHDALTNLGLSFRVVLITREVGEVQNQHGCESDRCPPELYIIFFSI